MVPAQTRALTAILAEHYEDAAFGRRFRWPRSCFTGLRGSPHVLAAPLDRPLSFLIRHRPARSRGAPRMATQSQWTNANANRSDKSMF
jgi:hypothetical protein